MIIKISKEREKKMNDIFCETLVKKTVTSTDKMKKILLFVVSIIVSFACLFYIPMIGTLLGVGVWVFVYFILKYFYIEFEYTLTMNELDFAKIISKEKRKHLLTLDLKEVTIIAPSNHQKIKDAMITDTQIFDYSSNDSSKKKYSIIGKHNGKNIQILFEPSANMLQGIRKQFPSKTIIEN